MTRFTIAALRVLPFDFPAAAMATNGATLVAVSAAFCAMSPAASMVPMKPFLNPLANFSAELFFPPLATAGFLWMYPCFSSKFNWFAVGFLPDPCKY